MIATPPGSAPVVEIADDPGGHLFPRQAEVDKWRHTGTKVRISGTCASACTLVLSLPPEQVCVTKDAALGFHEGSNDVATTVLWQSYPARIKGWLASENAGDQDRNITSIPLTSEVRWLKGKDSLGPDRACGENDMKPQTG